jgi:hypothetical protein
MMLPRVDTALDLSSILVIFFIAFSTHALQTCHRHKKHFGSRLDVANASGKMEN